MMQIMSKTTRLGRLQKVLAGLGKHFQPAATLQVGGVTYTVQALTGLIQGDIDAVTASAKAKADWQALVQAERNAHAKAAPILRQLEGLVVNMFGDTQEAVSTLEDFGFKPRTRTKPTAKTQVDAQGKAEATRKARHTASPKAKKAITGASSPATPTPPKA